MKLPVILVPIRESMSALNVLNKVNRLLNGLDTTFVLDVKSFRRITLSVEECIQVLFPLGVIENLTSLSDTLPEDEHVMLVYDNLDIASYKVEYLKTCMKLLKDLIEKEIGDDLILREVDIKKLKRAEKALDEKLTEIFRMEELLKIF